MATVIGTLEHGMDKLLYALSQHGLSEKIAFSMIRDVCNARLKHMSQK